MHLPLHQVVWFERVADYTLRIRFEDGTEQVIDFFPLLHGELFTPLRDPAVFNQVRIDPEWQTLVWPNGADFDPSTLYYWHSEGPAMIEMAESWRRRQNEER